MEWKANIELWPLDSYMEIDTLTDKGKAQKRLVVQIVVTEMVEASSSKNDKTQEADEEELETSLVEKVRDQPGFCISLEDLSQSTASSSSQVAILGVTASTSITSSSFSTFKVFEESNKKVRE